MRTAVETPRRGVSTNATKAPPAMRAASLRVANSLLLRRALPPVLALMIASACGGGAQPAPSPPGELSATGGAIPLPPMTITFNAGAGNEAQLLVETADTPEERQRGLMFRESLPEDSGMLFDFGQETRSAFWMKDTTLPLSIAFVSMGGAVVDIQDMAPFSEELHRSPQPYRYAVEANQGWFEAHGVVAGSAARILPPSS